MNKLVLAFALLSVVACKKKQTDEPPPPPGSGTATMPIDAAAIPPPPAEPDASAPAVADAAAPVDQATLCPKVLDKIALCKSDPTFAAALAEGETDAAKKKEIDRLVKGISSWPKNVCTYEYNFEYPGFLEHWDQLGAPDILESCAKLGAAVKGARGLFGGEIAK